MEVLNSGSFFCKHDLEILIMFAYIIYETAVAQLQVAGWKLGLCMMALQMWSRWKGKGFSCFSGQNIIYVLEIEVMLQ